MRSYCAKARCAGIGFLFIGLLVLTVIPALQANEAEDMSSQTVLFDFSNAEDIAHWRIVNDGVMGGRSQSTITRSAANTAIFKGTISLENNGGFASTRTVSRAYDLADYSGIVLRVTGDGKPYQFRLRADNRFDGIAYRYEFATVAGEAIEVKVPFSELVPVFRGRVLNNVGPIDSVAIQQLGFLFGNKQAEAFRLEIDWIAAYKH
jgi:monofunctional biosynthetic peptidoglycan transglycosylase